MDDEEYSDDALLSGDGSDTDWIANNGGSANPYIQNQSAVDAADNGLITSNKNVAGGNTASYTPPGWLSSFTSLLSGASQAVTTLAPIVNGQPLGSAGVSTGKLPAAGASTVKPASSSMMYIIGAIVLAVVGFLFWKKRGK